MKLQDILKIGIKIKLHAGKNRQSPVKLVGLLLGVCLVLVAAGRSTSQSVKPSKVISGVPITTVHGATFDEKNRLYLTGLFRQSIYRVDRKSGKAEVFVGAPSGEADDLEFATDGTLVWTSFYTGLVHGRKPDGRTFEIARIPNCNPISFNKQGRLFIAQSFEGTGLFEVFLDGRKPRKIRDVEGGMNGFDFGPDGLLYSPLQKKGEIVKINVDTGEIQLVASGFKLPGAAKFDSKGNLWVADVTSGEVVRVDVKTGKKTVIARVMPGIDNLAIDSIGRIVTTNNSSSYEINPETGQVRTIFENKISAPGGLGIFTEAGQDNLYLADLLDFRVINGKTGEEKTLARSLVNKLPLVLNATVNERHVES